MADPIVISKPTGMLECKSVGAIVRNKDGEFLLLDRRKGVSGWACPAGHLEGNENNLSALRRELAEETGVQVNDAMKLILHAGINNACQRGFDAHEWRVYFLEAASDHVELKEPDKHKGIGWFNSGEIAGLNLEPVWLAIFLELDLWA